MKVSLCAIEKNEDNYIDEWIRYYIALGVDDIYIYQNDWRANLKSNYENKVHLIEFDGSCKLLPAYNNFITTYYTKYDFALVFDIDEYLSLDGFHNIKDWLKNYLDVGAIAINWRLFGDSGLKGVKYKNYSLVTRFTHCEKHLNRHVKQILNFNIIKNNYRFVNPHFIYPVSNIYSSKISVNTQKDKFVYGPFNQNQEYGGVQLNHYLSKTIEEWIQNKIPKGKCDFPYNSPEQLSNTVEKFKEFNFNDVEHLTVLEFWNKYVGE